MKRTLSGVSQQYVTALKKYLKQSPRPSPAPARNLGYQAMALGLETLGLARLHEQALVVLGLCNQRNGATRRAAVFFTEALTPIMETHGPARQNKLELIRTNEMLNQRTEELASTNRQLKHGILRRKSVEAALKKSGIHYTRLLKDSLQLQENLRQLTHRMLKAQENERRKISIELQDEIAQTLLGINVRLLSLKQDARNNTKNLKKEISSTQRLVATSAQSVRRVARGFRNA